MSFREFNAFEERIIGDRKVDCRRREFDRWKHPGLYFGSQRVRPIIS